MTGPLPIALFREQLDVSPYPTLIADPNSGEVLYVSQNVAQWTQDIVGKTYYELGFWPDDGMRDRVIAAASRPGGSTRRYDAGNGRTHVVTSRIVTFDGEDYLISSAVDITNHIRVEAELERTLARLENAQALALVGDFIVDLDAGTLDGSSQFLKMFGFELTSKVVPLRDVIARFHEDDRDRVINAFQELEPGEELTMAHRLDVDEEQWVETRLELHADADGRRFVRGATQDVTERKRAERERERLLVKMQEAQRLESLGLLSGGVAHDFNNLLAGILGNADFALLESDLSPELEHRLRDIVAAAQRAAELTRQLLAYSGRGRFVIEPTSLTAMVREMADLLRITIDKRHALSLDLTDPLPRVDVDRTQLRQVVINLIQNASEAIEHDDGRIRVTTAVREFAAGDPRPTTLSSNAEHDRYVALEVSDNGVGMDRETQARLYDPFFTTKFTGRGLGMAAVQGIVRGHHGAVEVDSRVGQGTTIRIFLPVSHEPAEADVEDHDDAAENGAILVIDDEAAVREFIATVLTRFGHTALAAATGREGLELFDDHRDAVALVLLDLTMPHMDGLEVFAELRRRDRDVPVVLMSGYNEQHAMEGFRAQDLVGFLAKPFLVNDLISLVNAAVKGSSATD